MGFYNGTAMEVLCQQVMRDNPNMAGKLSSETVFATGTVVARSANNRNTQITLAGYPGKGFLGEVTFSYDRINLASLFGNVTAGPITIPYRATTRAAMLPYINEQLGLNLTVDEINNPDIVGYPSTTPSGVVTVVAATGSVCYIGTVNINWVREDPAFTDLYLPENGVNGLWRSQAAAAAVFRKSWNNYTSQINSISKNLALKSNQSATNALVALLRNWSGVPWEVNLTLGAGDYDITDATCAISASRLLSDANGNYKSVLVITPTPGKHKWTVPLYLHYSPQVAETLTASADDFQNYAAVAGLPVATNEDVAKSFPGLTVIVDMALLKDTDVYYGNVWGSRVFARLSGLMRIAQHCFPTKECFDYAVANKLKVALTFGALITPSTAYQPISRNGYTSSFYSQEGGTSAITVTKFVYYDVRYSSMRYLNPATAPAETTVPAIWLP